MIYLKTKAVWEKILSLEDKAWTCAGVIFFCARCLKQCDRKREGDSWVRAECRRRWSKTRGEIRESRECGYRERERRADENRGRVIIPFNLPPLWIDLVMRLAHTLIHPHIHLHWFDWAPVRSSVALLFTTTVYSTSGFTHTHTQDRFTAWLQALPLSVTTLQQNPQSATSNL